ncbi:MAG: diaminopimelate decarboxylase [Clostridia bacterium]|nr:diaminopimelate decarboxylase [Clostridia bacterium]
MLEKVSSAVSTPAYVFNSDEFAARCRAVRDGLDRRMGLCFSIKANPFLLHILPDAVDHVEVCSPGELHICKAVLNAADAGRIIYSGVNKGMSDVTEALEYGVGIITAESPSQAALINDCAAKLGIRPRVILRLTSGNQFGMDAGSVRTTLLNSDSYPCVDFVGLHYYSGTQKKSAGVIKKDAASFFDLAASLESETGWSPELMEYGPGAAVDYFGENSDEVDADLLEKVCNELNVYADRYSVNVEMGRFLAAPCGTYFTRVADIKNNDGSNFIICDGGINHLNYYGQTMAMKVPHITALNSSETAVEYTLCGSLCTTADLLVRKVALPELKVGDVLAFARCGAYSVTEGIALFLSRELPAVYLYSDEKGLHPIRDVRQISDLNI